jgi:hypothetical protein
MLFLLKIAITPLLVAAVSLASRWWGPTVGGILIGLPWFTGPTLFILVHEKDAAFGVAACVGVELGVVCVAAYVLTYGLTSVRARWPSSLAAGVAAFAACAWATHDAALLSAITRWAIHPLWAAAGLALVSLAVIYVLLPVPRIASVVKPLPWWDIPMRMVTTAALVTAIMLGADVLGPQLSGIVSTFPVILTVIATFTHHRWGREAVWRVLRGLTRSLVAFVVYFLIVGLALPGVGLMGAYVIASVAGLALATALLMMERSGAFT